VQCGGLSLGTLFTLWTPLLKSFWTPLIMLPLCWFSLGSLYLTLTTTSTHSIIVGFTFGKTIVFLSNYKYRHNSFRHFDTLSCSLSFNHIMNRSFKILNPLFKLFILMFSSIIRRWSSFVPWYYFLPFWHVESLFFFMN
jgi:hypothetical protein